MQNLHHDLPIAAQISLNNIQENHRDFAWDPVLPINNNVNVAVSNLVKKVFDKVKANSNRNANRTVSPLVSLPQLAILKIFAHLSDQVTDSIFKIKLGSICKDLYEISKFQDITSQSDVLEKVNLLNSMNEYLQSDACVDLFMLIINNGLWCVFEWSIVLQINTHLQKYLLYFPLSLTTISALAEDLEAVENEDIEELEYMDDIHEMVEPKNDMYIKLAYGNASELFKTKLLASDDQVEMKKAIRKVLTNCATAAASHIMNNLKIHRNTNVVVSVNSINVGTNNANPTVPKFKISYVLSIFDGDDGTFNDLTAQQRIKTMNQPYNHNINLLSKHLESIVNHGIQTRQLEPNETNTLLQAQPDARFNSGILSFYPLVINWFSKNDSAKIVLIETEPKNGAATRNKANTPVFFEKQTVNGRQRNIYKLRNKRYVKLKGNCFMGLKEYLTRTLK